jgi:hypothetical protein
MKLTKTELKEMIKIEMKSLKEGLNPDVAKHMVGIHKGFIKVEDDGVMIYDSPTTAKKAADYLNSKKVAASSDGKYLYIESVNKVSPKRKTTVTESFMEKTSGIFYKKTKELVKKGELSADVAKVLERLFQDAVSAAFSEGARGGFRR